MPIGRKINKSDIGLMSQYLLCGSERNKDAWGVTNGKKVYNREGVFKEKNTAALKDFEGSNFLVGHNRLATQGETRQPISNKGWIVAHNGIFHDYSRGKCKSAKDSDTALFLKDFVQSNVTLKEFMETVGGSYSMFMINRDTNELFYLKSSTTCFHFALLRNKQTGHRIIVGSTSKNNIKDNLPRSAKYGFGIEQYQIESMFEPDYNTMYKITKRDGVTWFDSYETRYKYKGNDKDDDDDKEDKDEDTKEEEKQNNFPPWCIKSHSKSGVEGKVSETALIEREEFDFDSKRWAFKKPKTDYEGWLDYEEVNHNT
jgi:hypothetical protein